VDRVPPADGHPRRNIGAILCVLITASGLCLAVFLLLIRQGEEDPERPAVTPAPAYRVVYRVVDRVSVDQRVRGTTETDVLEVERPDRLRLEHREGLPPGGRLLEGSIVNGRFTMTFPDEVAHAFSPLTVLSEPRLFSEPALRAAADAGKAESLGRSSIMGQPCNRYRYRHFGGESLSEGDGQEHVDTCVTPDSIMLREAIEFSGREVRVSEAVQLDRAPHFAQDTFVATGGQGDFHGQLTWPYSIERFTRGGEFVASEQFLVRDVAGHVWDSTGSSPIDLGIVKGSILYHTGYVEVQTSVDGAQVRVLASRLQLALNEAERLYTRGR
jgi:hypothetical protein